LVDLPDPSRKSRHTNNIGSQGIRLAAESTVCGKVLFGNSANSRQESASLGFAGLRPAPILGVGDGGEKMLAGALAPHWVTRLASPAAADAQPL